MSADVASGGIDQSGMRRVNTAMVLRALVEQREPLTMADLVTRTRLSRRTLELILASLCADDWAIETEAPQSAGRVGRPKKFYALAPERALVVAVLVDERDISVVVADLRGDECAVRHARADEYAIDTVLALAVRTARETIADAGGALDRVRAVAVGVGGTVSDAGVILTSPVLPQWEGADVRRPFAEAFAVPVLVENDTNLAALAERWSGAAADVDTFVMLIPGARLSAGLIIDGAIHRGIDGAAGELIRIRGVDIERWREHPVAAITAPDPADSAPARAILERARDGDAEARALAADFFAGVAGLVSVIGWLVAPPLVVLRGEFTGVEDVTLELVRIELARVGAPALDVRLARHGQRGSVRGGVRLALDALEGELYSAPGI